MARRRGKRKKRVSFKQKCANFAKWFKGLKTWKKLLLIASVVLLVLGIAGVSYAYSLYNKMDIEDFDEDDIIINDDFLPEEVKTGYTKAAGRTLV